MIEEPRDKNVPSCTRRCKGKLHMVFPARTVEHFARTRSVQSGGLLGLGFNLKLLTIVRVGVELVAK